MSSRSDPPIEPFDLLAIGQATAAALGEGWSAGPVEPRSFASDDILLEHADGRRIELHLQSWRSPTQIRAVGVYPDGPDGPPRVDEYRVCVRPDRGAHALASRIRSGLLPGYQSELQEVLAVHARDVEISAMRAQAAQAIIALLPGARLVPHMATRTSTYLTWTPSWSHDHRRSGAAFRFDDTTSTAEITLTGIPRHLAEEICKVLGRAHRALP